MADLFTIVTSYQDVEFLGGTNTRDVQVAGATTKQNGIYFEVRVQKQQYEQQGPSIINAAALGMANILETLSRQPNVGGVQWGQQSAGGQLQDVAIITVVSDSGNSSSTYTVPIVQLGPDLNEAEIETIAHRLNQTEHL